MPTYTYRFEDGIEVEVVQSIHDDPLVHYTHPERLHAMPVKRVPQPVVADFKGGGWARV